MNTKKIQHTFKISAEQIEKRLDQILVQVLPEYSRAQLQVWLKSGEITVNKKIKKSKDRLKIGDIVVVDACMPIKTEAKAEDITLDIIFEDESIIVVNKPAQFVVHPGAGVSEGTLMNALLHHCHELNRLPRAGIVHRLDKNTTGIMVVAKTNESYHTLVKQIKERTVKRVYHAVVKGVVISGGKVEAPIGRHTTQRTKMAVVPSGKASVTHYRVLKKYIHFTLLEVSLETGRTHQIRVHMAHIKHPLAADFTYGSKQYLKSVAPEVQFCLEQFARQALHAKTLKFNHPLSLEQVEFNAPYPSDFEQLLNILEDYDATINNT